MSIHQRALRVGITFTVIFAIFFAPVFIWGKNGVIGVLAVLAIAFIAAMSYAIAKEMR